MAKCPGSQFFNQPKPEAINCPRCGYEVEIWSDEIKTTCPGCKKTVMRATEATCLDWCRYAKDCAGDQIYSVYIKNKTSMLKQKLLKEMEAVFGDDTKRINHAKNVMNFAEELLKKEAGDWHIIMPACILHDVGIKEAERKSNAVKDEDQERESAALARKILLKHGGKMEDIDQICEIIANHHSPGKINTQNFKILYDADGLVNFKDKANRLDRAGLEKAVDSSFLTGSGREAARRIYLK
ncbi:MAG: HD domain-containing protein [Candidatus Omnitrophota bacterium]